MDLCEAKRRLTSTRTLAFTPSSSTFAMMRCCCALSIRRRKVIQAIGIRERKLLIDFSKEQGGELSHRVSVTGRFKRKWFEVVLNSREVGSSYLRGLSLRDETGDNGLSHPDSDCITIDGSCN